MAAAHCGRQTDRSACGLRRVSLQMIIFSFGSGFQIESTGEFNMVEILCWVAIAPCAFAIFYERNAAPIADESYIAKIKASIDYAKAHGNIEVGAYDLIALTRNPPNASWAEISPETGGHDGNACFASGWRDFCECQAELRPSVPPVLQALRQGSLLLAF